jgi:hypothetical protein
MLNSMIDSIMGNSLINNSNSVKQSNDNYV